MDCQAWHARGIARVNPERWSKVCVCFRAYVCASFSNKPRDFRYNYHMWVHQWTSWQYDLDAETFDGATEIVVVTDFSAVYEMKDNVGEKC